MKCIGLGLAVVVTASFASTGSATTITQAQGFAALPGVRQDIAFDRFDPSRGRLLSVEWRLLLDIDGGAQTVDNDDLAPKTVTVNLGARGSLFSEDVTLLDASMHPILREEAAVTAATSTQLVLAADDGDGMLFDPAGPDAGTHLGGYASASSGAFVNAVYFDEYVGTELFKLQVELQPLAEVDSAVSASAEVTPVTAMPNVMLIYQYEPVPEPTGLGAWLLAALAAPAIRRRTDFLSCRP
jgi:hypothetical protein